MRVHIVKQSYIELRKKWNEETSSLKPSKRNVSPLRMMSFMRQPRAVLYQSACRNSLPYKKRTKNNECEEKPLNLPYIHCMDTYVWCEWASLQECIIASYRHLIDLSCLLVSEGDCSRCEFQAAWMLDMNQIPTRPYIQTHLLVDHVILRKTRR